MYEVEMKVRTDHEAVHERLGKLDADFGGTISQEDTYYDAPHRDFAETDEALRIRRETIVEPRIGRRDRTDGADVETERKDSKDPGDTIGATDGEAGGTEGDSAADDVETVVLTYKGPLVDDDSKTRREVETEVEDGERTDGILAALGFSPAATVRKQRSIHAAADGEWKVVLDAVEGLGEFVEVELETEEDSIDAARERLVAVLETLGLDPDEQVRTSYLGLLLDRSDGSVREPDDGRTRSQ